MIALLFFIFLCAIPAQAVQIQIGGSTDATIPPPPPCSTLGFVEETQLTLPTGFNQGRFMRVMKTPYNNIGYVITEDGSSQRLAVFDLTTMTLRATATLGTFPGKYRQAGRIQGDIDPDSRLYVFREARNGGGSCAGGAGFNCISFARFLENASLQSEVISGPDATANLDDARDDFSGGYILLHAANTATLERRFDRYSKNSLGLLATGTLTGISAFGHLSRFFNNHLYGILESTTANGWSIPSGSPVADGTFSMTASFGLNLIGAIHGLTNDAGLLNIVGESGNTVTNAVRGYVNTGLVNFATSNYTAAEQGAAFQSSFYDSFLNRVFSVRNNNVLVRTTPGVVGFAIEQTFTCLLCNYANQQTQTADYAPHKMRLFTVSNGTPAVINRIKVCAVGGAPA